jgi:hypothetical protein
MSRKLALLVLTVLAATGAYTPARRDTPWPELKKLDYFVGDWFEEGDVKAGLAGAGGRVTQHDHREWMEGGFFVVIHSTFTALKGEGIGIEFMGYDPNAKLYTYDEFYSQGEADHSKGRFEGDKVIWEMGDMKVGAKMVRARNTYTIVSPTLYTFKFETSTDGGKTWTLTMDGTGKKLSK